MNYKEKEIESIDIDFNNVPKLLNWNISRKMLHKTSLNAAIIYCELKNRRDYALYLNPSHYDYWFNFSQEDMQKETGLTPHQQRKAISQLVENKIIETAKFGLPAKNYFFINDIEVIKNNF